MTYKIFSLGSLQTNCTVLEKDGACVVVDVAFGAHALCDYIVSRNLNLAAVLLTHGHYDHCGGVRQLLRETNSHAPVFVNERDVELCRHAKDNFWYIPAENCEPTNFVVQGVLRVGDFVFEVLETPGHTEGSVCYLIDDLLFSGDTLMRLTVGRTDFPESVPSKMCDSLNKLKAIPDDHFVIAGHGETTALNFEKLHNPYLRK